MCVCVCGREREREDRCICACALQYVSVCVLVFDLCVYIGSVLTYPYDTRSPLTTVCLSHRVLPSRNCCYAKCSHLVVKRRRGLSPLPSLSLHFSTEGSSLGLWCSSCLVQVLSASSLQSLPHAPRGLLGRIIHILSTLPDTRLFQMAGPACLSERLSAKCERMCVLNGISLCMALPTLLYTE